jgi:uncharacterized membrane protein
MEPHAPQQLPPSPGPSTGWSAPPAPPTPQQLASSESSARIVYILYLASLLFGITAVIGVVMAYVHQGAAPAGLDTHYRYQIRTFWIGLLYLVVGGILTVVYVGALVLLFALVWFVVRCVKGLKLLGERQPVPDPATWLW